MTVDPRPSLDFILRRTFAISATAAVSVTAAGVFLSARSASPTLAQADVAPATVPVLASTAESKDVPLLLRGLGTVTAYNTVNIESRVEGAITGISFKEGQAVHTGDLLIQLDPRPYEAMLAQATANVARDKAQLANDKVNLGRYSELLKRNYTPEQTVATQQTTVAEDQAAIERDQAALQAAQLNVDYAALRSPVDGVTGVRHVDLGNLIPSGTAQNLVTVTQIKPIYVVFTLPEADISRVRDAMTGGTLSVEAYSPGDVRKISAGKLNLIDNTVNQTTGTVELKAEFANDDGKLWPGEFVNAHLLLKTVHNGVTIPAAAVQTGPDGSFTYVVSDQSEAIMTPIKVQQTEANTSLIASGLKGGERVVTSGQFRLQPNSKVNIVEQLADPGPALTDAPEGTTGTR